MSKRPSLFSVSPPASADPPAPPSSPPDAPARSGRAKSREGKKSMAVYVDPAAWRQLKKIAVDEDTTVEDLLREGMNEVFAKRGLSRIA